MAALFSGILAGATAGGSLLDSISNTVIQSKQLQLQQQQLELNRGALRLQAAQPYLNAQTTRLGLQAKFEAMRELGADPQTLYAAARGTTIYSGGREVYLSPQTTLQTINPRHQNNWFPGNSFGTKQKDNVQSTPRPYEPSLSSLSWDYGSRRGSVTSVNSFASTSTVTWDGTGGGPFRTVFNETRV